ncbi:MAG: sigma-54-dependent Fis family transcriptional regulator, partial [Deltaproteobacteria bacterium]|nr:sigma-54-dependent Fis family transcriptional regulator [Deltaproteobacteria bacterium]
VADGNFRRDLYFRLNVILITVPPLRERRDDISLLLEHFLRRKNAALKTRKTIAPECHPLLQGYGWPGNVRELSNVVERALILSSGDELTPRDFAFLSGPRSQSHLPSLRQLEEDHIHKVLRDVNQNKAQAARVLGISVRNLYRKLDEFGGKKPGAMLDDS